MSLSAELVTLIRNKPVSQSDLDQTALFVLDAVVSAIAGSVTQPGKLLIQWGRAQTNDAARQALLSGGMAHILEVDDLHRASVTHPGCVVVPASMALAVRESASGADLLRGVLHGFEAMCRIGMAVGQEHYRVWHNTATCGPFGSAMAAAALLGLSDQQAVHALGNAGTQSSGLWQFLETGAMSKHLHAGRAAEAGVVAAELAALGFTGPPKILEGDKGFFVATCKDADPDAVLRAPEAPWQLTQTSIKPWPCCRHTHPIIDACLSLAGQLDADRVEAITIGTYQAVLDVCNRISPQSEYEAKFSAHHCVAAALTDGEVTFDSFTPLARARLAALASKVTLHVDPDYVGLYPDHWGARVEVTTKLGERWVAERSSCLGDPQNRLGRDAMIEKARFMLAFAGWGEPDALNLIDHILNMPQASRVLDLLNWRQ